LVLRDYVVPEKTELSFPDAHPAADNCVVSGPWSTGNPQLLINPRETDNASSWFTALPGARFGLLAGEYVVDGVQQPVVANQRHANLGSRTRSNAAAAADQL
jgi:hypothetical protein